MYSCTEIAKIINPKPNEYWLKICEADFGTFVYYLLQLLIMGFIFILVSLIAYKTVVQFIIIFYNINHPLYFLPYYIMVKMTFLCNFTTK